ncbi:MAG: ribose 5-phosphate isomerase B [Gemmatimonadota bacterium]|jgi:ribose 5-phosphate isomerase B
MRIAIGTDHAGWSYKEFLVHELREAGHDLLDLGTHGPESVDYPDFARPVAETVARGEADRGILLCGSAVGVSLVANKVPGIRAAVCHDCYSAHQGVEHDDVNVLCLGARVIGIELAREIVHRFLEARFSEDPRHRRRLEKLIAVERTYMKEPETD